MRTVLLLLACLPALSAYPNGYSYRRSITVQAAQITSGPLTNFAFPVSGTYSYLATVANGGLVTNDSGFDIIFTQSDGTTLLKYERELYTATDGTVVFWVKHPSIDVGTVIYIYYGNSGVSTDQSDAVNVWDSNYKLVSHLPNGTTLTAGDSTGVNNGTITAATATAGKIDGAGDFNGTSAFVDHGNNASLRPATGSTLTLSAWVNLDVKPGGGNFPLIAGIRDGDNDGYWLELNGDESTIGFIAYNGSFAKATFPYASVSTGVWFYIVGVIRGSGANQVEVYLNGVSQTPATGGMNQPTDSFLVAKEPLGAVWYIDGKIDEVRMSTTARAANWIEAEFNSQGSPSTFYAIGSQEASDRRRITIFSN